MKEFIRRLGILFGYIIGYISVVFAPLVIIVWWAIAYDNGNSSILFITNWILIPLVILIVGCSLIFGVYEFIVWLFVEPFKKSDK